MGYIGKEKDAESSLADHGVRKYDSETGRFTAVDPLSEKYYSLTLYQYAANNPISFVDGNGAEFYVGTDGIMLGNKVNNPNDMTVYLVNNAGGMETLSSIGQKGQEINITEILDHIIEDNLNEVSEYDFDVNSFIKKMNTKGDWDLKNRSNSIFKLCNDNKTQFRFDRTSKTDPEEYLIMNSQDVGNFHYGVIGAEFMQKLNVGSWVLNAAGGIIQIKDNRSKLSWMSSFFDDPNDQAFINYGIEYQKEWFGGNQ